VNVLFLPQTSELGPSSRYRVYQLLPALTRLGIHGEVSPGIDSELYREIYWRGERKKLAAMNRIWRTRKHELARVEKFDAVLVQKGFFPGLYAGIELAIAKRRPLVFDLDDAIWLPRQGGSRLLRALHRESAVQQILRDAAAVTAGNEFLAQYCRRFNANVTIMPSVIDPSKYAPTTGGNTIGWIGSRTTLPYLAALRTVFEKLRVKPLVIASGNPSVLGFDVNFKPWRLETEAADIGEIGIGIAPLPDTLWERGKCGVKILQYMAAGAPVVASPVGVHNKLVRNGVNGFLARDESDWIDRLSELMADKSLREKLGARGRQTVLEHYDVPVAAERLAKVFEASTHTSGMTGKLNRKSA
jgi:hypothetical protein